MIFSPNKCRTKVYIQLNYFVSNNIISVSATNYPVKVIGFEAFIDTGLTSVVIPNGVTTIDIHAFYNNQLSSVTIPSFVTLVYCTAFNNNVTINKENQGLVCYDNTGN